MFFLIFRIEQFFKQFLGNKFEGIENLPSNYPLFVQSEIDK